MIRHFQDNIDILALMGLDDAPDAANGVPLDEVCSSDAFNSKDDCFAKERWKRYVKLRIDARGLSIGRKNYPFAEDAPEKF